MNLLSFSYSEVPKAISAITGFIRENPILCGVLFLSYVIFYLYMFIYNKSADSEVYEIDLISNGISSIMVALLLIGLDETSKGFNFSGINLASPKTKIAIFLLIYAMLMIIFAFIKIFPRILVIMFGNSELDLFINLVAVLLTDSEIVMTGTILFVIAVPLLALLVIQRIRRLIG